MIIPLIVTDKFDKKMIIDANDIAVVYEINEPLNKGKTSIVMSTHNAFHHVQEDIKYIHTHLLLLSRSIND